MERFTISMDDELAAEFDRLIVARGYANRSEAVRDLVRALLQRERIEKHADGYCIANLSYVFNHHERDLAERLAALQHGRHDLTVATMHVHLDHVSCLESVILRGPTRAVRAFADAMIAERGVRHGSVNLVAVDVDGGGDHHHGDASRGKTRGHLHLKPKG